MNTDVEGDRLKAAAVVEVLDDAAERLADEKNGTFAPSDVLLTEIRLETDQPARAEHRVVPSRQVAHVSILVLIVLALCVGWLSEVPGVAGSSALSTQTFKQRLLLVTSLDHVSSLRGERGFLRRTMPPSTVDTPDLAAAPDPVGRGGAVLVNTGFVTRGIDPEGNPEPPSRTQVINYSVRYGDTLWTIAQKFSITQDSLWANNDLRSPDMLSIGDELTIPPVDGLIYKVRKGDTLEGLAQRYKTSVEAIVDYEPNGLSERQQPKVGQEIIIPGGVKPIPPRRTVSLTSAPAGALKGVGSFVMPVSGVLTQGFHPGHAAIDIGAPRGTPVYAADAGYVSFAGWHPWGYGYAVELDHGNGFRTLYAHLSYYAPDLGDSVKRGELIGGVGSTYGSGGWSSGPHLHFEILQKGAKRNPCVFLPCP